MADDGLIEPYLDELRASMRWHRDADDIVAEAEDHLRSNVEHLVARGIEVEEAQRRALGSFGEPAMVAHSHATNRRGRLALPTRSTRDAGVVGVIAGAAWLAVPVVWLLGGWLYDRVGPTNPGDDLGSPAQTAVMIVIGGTLLAATALLFVTMVMLRERHGGFSLAGMVGIGASGIGAAASLLGWFYVGWGSVVVVATVLVSVELWRGGIAPKAWVATSGVGMSLGAAVWGVLRIAEVGNPDRHGEYPIANATGLIVGPVILGVGLIGLARWLRNEEPVDLDTLPPVGSDPANCSSIASPTS